MRTLESILDQRPEKADTDIFLATIINPLSQMMEYESGAIERLQKWLINNWDDRKFSLKNGVLTLGNWPNRNNLRGDCRTVDWTNISTEDRENLCKIVKEIKISGIDTLTTFTNDCKGGKTFPSKYIADGFDTLWIAADGSLENIHFKGSNEIEISSDNWQNVHFKNVRVECKDLVINWDYTFTPLKLMNLNKFRGLKMDGIETLTIELTYPSTDISLEIWNSWKYGDKNYLGPGYNGGMKNYQLMIPKPGKLPWFIKLAPKSCSQLTVYIGKEVYTFTRTSPHPQALEKDGWYATYSKNENS